MSYSTLFFHPATVEIEAFEQASSGARGIQITLDGETITRAVTITLFLDDDGDQAALALAGELHDAHLDLADIVLDGGA